MTAEDPIRLRRDQRIAELEQRVARQNPVGVAIPVALLAIGASGYLLATRAKDLAYFFSSKSPVTLGAAGDYHFERLRSNVYAQVHGAPTERGLYTHESGNPFVMAALRDTPLVVHRRPLAGEKWTPGTEPPRPNQNPLVVRGRLLAEGDAPAPYQEGLKKLAAMGQLQPKDGRLWILLEGQPPGADRAVFLSSLALLGFLLLNGWFLWRNLARRFRPNAHGFRQGTED